MKNANTTIVMVVCGAVVALTAIVPAASAKEPTGEQSRVLFRESFDDANLAERGWYDGRKVKIVRDNPFAGEGCIAYHWNEGATKSIETDPIRHLFAPTDSVYVRFFIRLSSNWDWSRRPYHPHLMHFMTTENPKFHGPASSHLTLYVEPVGGRLRLGTQDIQNKDAPHGLTQGPLRGGYNGKSYESDKNVFRDDKWHCVEAYFKLNTLDMRADKPNADGTVRGWFDGKLVVDRDDVVLRSTDFPRMQFNQYLLAPYFGPRLLPHAQTLWIDELVVATGRVSVDSD